jgi:CRP/FNR family transcriptional regulator
VSRAAKLDIARHLAGAPLFSSLSAGARAELTLRSRVVSLVAQQRLWTAGDEATHVGLVLSGRLKLVQHVADREVIIDVALPGEILGEVAFALGSAYQSTVWCLRRARVLLVPADSLRQVLEREGNTMAALATSLAAQVQRLMRLIQDLSAGNVERRLARVLVGLAERAGEPFPGGVYVPLRLRRADLASLAATTKESVSRKVGAWTRSGWLVAQPVGYLIRDLQALRRVAEQPTGDERGTMPPPHKRHGDRERSRKPA